jgi:hypothetical protein
VDNGSSHAEAAAFIPAPGGVDALLAERLGPGATAIPEMPSN